MNLVSVGIIATGFTGLISALLIGQKADSANIDGDESKATELGAIQTASALVAMGIVILLLILQKYIAPYLHDANFRSTVTSALPILAWLPVPCFTVLVVRLLRK